MNFDQYEALPWQDVDSSNIRRVALVEGPEETEHGTLYIEFHGGRAYSYADVPDETFEELIAAESVTSYFNAEIKTEFETSRVQVTR